ncbi:MAG: PP2C family protein-serine/threonine phosphatase [Lachnospiraceae bacterium]|nr:PP2C family protein-serine/threonine phosphatase [Lachnospiraceae bacterium]
MKKEKSLQLRLRDNLITQIALLFLAGVICIGIGTYISQTIRSRNAVKAQMERFASQIATEVRMSVDEYTSYKWLLRYWREHADEMFIEYDVRYTKDTLTAARTRMFNSRYPDIELKYVNMSDIQMMSAEDQKLYAEIAYSWLITRINEIKRSYDVDYLFCVLTNEPYDRQFFLFSAADAGAVRGNEYEQVYKLGAVSDVGKSQQESMRDAVENDSHLADAGAYVDYYALLEKAGDDAFLIGLTYDLSTVKETIRDEALHDTSFAIIYQLLTYLLFMILTYVFILAPLKKVQHNIRIYANTKDSEEVIRNLEKVRPHNEIGELSTDVSDLAQEITEYTTKISEITAERERIGVELTLATRIQESMIPHIFPPYPDRAEFDIFAAMDPAKEVGGDFYDYYMIDNDHIGIVMADVSGKGIPAALFMMASKIILANNFMAGKMPAQVLADSNDMISRHNPEEMFVTVWAGILEISTGKLTAANAGHEYPVIRHGNGRFELLKDKHGFVVGGMGGMKYEEYELQLEPDSRLFLYTDGVPEATDPDDQLFGTERMMEALNQLSETDARSVLEGVRKAVDEFTAGAEQFDDLTMLCLEYRGNGEKNG